MSFFDCLNDAMDEGSADRERGERAQAMWKDRADLYERQGHPRHTAEALAAQDVKEAFRKEAGENRHVYLSRIAALRNLQAKAAAAAEPDMLRRMEVLDMQHRGLVRRFNGLVGAYLKRHHSDLLGRVKHEAEQVNILKELRGEATGNASAKALADAIRSAIEDMRLAFNERGGLIPKMENYDVPHSHNRLAIMRAGFDQWAASIDARLDWSRVIDPLTGKPMQAMNGKPPAEFRRSFLRSIYDNIVFGREVDEPTYGRPKGVATYRKHADSRVLHFLSAEDWIAYNKDFGSGGFHQSLMGHVQRMARDIALMGEFGPNPKLGAEYYGDLLMKKAKGDEAMTEKAKTSVTVGLRALNVMSGGGVPTNASEEWLSGFGSNARGLMTAAFLDRAIIASVSDLNSMRMAAKSMGLNPSSMIQRQIGVLQGLSQDELLRAGWVADTMADAGTALARFQQEVPTSEFVERLTQASMRVQGLSFWTDRARAVAYQEWAGHLMNFADRPYAELDGPMKAHFDKWGVTADDWNRFRATPFVAENGATFLMPIYWRNQTKMDARKADEIFFKFQGAAEEFLELAVPSRSLAAQAWVDPSAWNLPPGSVGYELLKSAGMFKSFTMTFTVNQYRQIQQAGGLKGGGLGYALDLAAGATVLGALSIQANELLFGRDPQDMTTADFWGRAALKGGGFAILGDIINTGQASWGGGFASYAAGPVLQLAQDAWDLGPKNAFDLLGDVTQGREIDTDFAKDVAKIGKRYTPMGQTPIIGPALDRLFWDQLQIMLDPESANELVSAATKRDNLVGGGSFWLPGDALPSRAPNLGNAIGQ